MNLVRVPHRGEGNPDWPLPKGYARMTREEQRMARVLGCRQWMVPLSAYPKDANKWRAEARVASLKLFDTYYLHPDPETGFDPLFYDDVPLPTPEIHWDLTREWASNRLNLGIMPRGSGKSVHNRKDMLLALISRPAQSFVYATSSHANAKLTGQVCKDQVYDNPRIFDDWSREPEFAGKIKPLRGDAPTGVEFFYLANGSWLQVRSAESKQRGLRPRRYRLDDPEYDPAASTSMVLLRAYVEELLFKIVLPMVMRAGCGCDWLATFVSRRHYAWHAMQLRRERVGGREVVLAEDPRFNYWSRYFISAATTDPSTGKLVSCWPEMWPATDLEKTSPEQVSLEEIERNIGKANFNSEYLGRPGDTDDRYFPSPSTRHSWWYEKPDDALETDPRASRTLLCREVEGEVVRTPLSDFLPACRLFITVDSSYTAGSDSDYKVASLFAHHKTTNELYLLDCWAKQGSVKALIEASFRMADLWRVPSIHPEVVKETFALYQAMDQIVKTRLTEQMGLGYLPKIIPIKPGQTAKVDKIASLYIRFEHALVKFPLFRKHLPQWRMLFDQIDEFNPDAPDGGLAHDDILDTVAMAHLFVAKGKFREGKVEGEGPQDAVDLILAGQTHREGVSLGMGIDWNRVDPEKVARVLAMGNKPRGPKRSFV